MSVLLILAGSRRPLRGLLRAALTAPRGLPPLCQWPGWFTREQVQHWQEGRVLTGQLCPRICPPRACYLWAPRDRARPWEPSGPLGPVSPCAGGQPSPNSPRPALARRVGSTLQRSKCAQSPGEAAGNGPVPAHRTGHAHHLREGSTQVRACMWLRRHLCPTCAPQGRREPPREPRVPKKPNEAMPGT